MAMTLRPVRSGMGREKAPLRTGDPLTVTLLRLLCAVGRNLTARALLGTVAL